MFVQLVIRLSAPHWNAAGETMTLTIAQLTTLVGGTLNDSNRVFVSGGLICTLLTNAEVVALVSPAGADIEEAFAGPWFHTSTPLRLANSLKR